MQQTVAGYKNLKHQYSLAMKVHKGWRGGRNGLKSESYLIYGCKIAEEKGCSTTYSMIAFYKHKKSLKHLLLINFIICCTYNHEGHIAPGISSQ
jgi:hypothetical protein